MLRFDKETYSSLYLMFITNIYNKFILSERLSNSL